MGSGRSVYNCRVEIDALKDKQWQDIKKGVLGQISSLAELLKGDFPKQMESVLANKGTGLFPEPSEFHPHCDCPDSARFCKHLAAVIYAIGNRLDSTPNI